MLLAQREFRERGGSKEKQVRLGCPVLQALPVVWVHKGRRGLVVPMALSDLKGPLDPGVSTAH